MENCAIYGRFVEQESSKSLFEMKGFFSENLKESLSLKRQQK